MFPTFKLQECPLSRPCPAHHILHNKLVFFTCRFCGCFSLAQYLAHLAYICDSWYLARPPTKTSGFSLKKVSIWAPGGHIMTYFSFSSRFSLDLRKVFKVVFI